MTAKNIIPVNGSKVKYIGNRANIGLESLISTNKADKTKLMLIKLPHVSTSRTR